jgi:hypothetical protein
MAGLRPTLCFGGRANSGSDRDVRLRCIHSCIRHYWRAYLGAKDPVMFNQRS